MANQEHILILKQGVEPWNKWMNKQIPKGIDLTEARLKGIDLGFPDLSEADFTEMNLVGIDFRGTNLKKTKLEKTNLIKADLQYANLNQASLSQAILLGANLEQANLIESNLQEADLSMANLKFATFKGANLSNAKLLRSFLIGVNFVEAILDEACLLDANISAANFTKASLLGTNLGATQALSTKFIAAKLTGACVGDWNINSGTRLDEVDCEYIYLGQSLHGEKQERRPFNRNFAPGEFTKLFQKSLETVDLIFRNGVDWDAFTYSFKKVQVENQGAQLDVQSIENKGDGILLVRVSVSPDANKEKIHSNIMHGYEVALKALEAQYQASIEGKDALIARQEARINRYEGQINRLFDIVEQQGSVQKALAENPRKISNYDQRNSQFAGGVVDAETVQSHQVGGDIYNTDRPENFT